MIIAGMILWLGIICMLCGWLISNRLDRIADILEKIKWEEPNDRA